MLVRDLSRTYGEGITAVTALKKGAFRASPGNLVAITGRFGSGKTTLLNLLGGLDSPTWGTILLGGRDISRPSERERTFLRRREVAFIFQAFALLPTLPALEIVVLAPHIDVGSSQVTHLDYVVVDRAGRLQIPKEYLLSLGIEDRAVIGLENGRIYIGPVANRPEH